MPRIVIKFFECYTGMKAELRVTWRGVFLPVLEKDQKGA